MISLYYSKMIVPSIFRVVSHGGNSKFRRHNLGLYRIRDACSLQFQRTYFPYGNGMEPEMKN